MNVKNIVQDNQPNKLSNHIRGEGMEMDWWLSSESLKQIAVDAREAEDAQEMGVIDTYEGLEVLYIGNGLIQFGSEDRSEADKRVFATEINHFEKFALRVVAEAEQ